MTEMGQKDIKMSEHTSAISPVSGYDCLGGGGAGPWTWLSFRLYPAMQGQQRGTQLLLNYASCSVDGTAYANSV
jgi:hypothetical protein